jgi:hypothetical protein
MGIASQRAVQHVEKFGVAWRMDVCSHRMIAATIDEGRDLDVV